MKRIIILFLAVATTLLAYSQTSLEDGDRCFDSGDYTCAETKYNEAFKLATGRDRQIAEIKLTRTKWCADHISLANQAFTNKDYKTAKENYQSILESNPKDTYAKSQLEKCTNLLKPPIITLSVSKVNLSFPSAGSNERLTITTNASSYSVNLLPSWCSVFTYPEYFIITCKANYLSTSRTGYFTVVAGDKTVRINVSQLGVTKKSTLSLTKERLSFASSGGKSEAITVNSNASTYSISLVPSWCSVKTYKSYFIVSCNANNNTKSRSDWFEVTAGDNKLKVFINQSGKENGAPVNGKCFNCPNAKYTWGITAGYVKKSFDGTEGIQLGLRVEPLFKYGFGLNTGLNLEGYATDMLSVYRFEKSFVQYAANVPIHLEYRMNFSKWFNVFIYGGAGVNLVTNSLFNVLSIPTTLDYGCGLRINHIQFNIGQSLYLGNLKNIKGFRIDRGHYQELILSFSWMF